MWNSIRSIIEKVKSDRNFLTVYDLLVDFEEGDIYIVYGRIKIDGVMVSVGYPRYFYEYISTYLQNKGYKLVKATLYYDFEKWIMSSTAYLVKDNKEIRVHYTDLISTEDLNLVYL